MRRLRPFQVAAQESGFVNAAGQEDGTVLWLRRQTPGPASSAHQRICMDTLTVSATVYWTDSQGNVASKTFRKAQALKDWLLQDPVS